MVSESEYRIAPNLRLLYPITWNTLSHTIEKVAIITQDFVIYNSTYSLYFKLSIHINIRADVTVKSLSALSIRGVFVVIYISLTNQNRISLIL